MNQTFRFVLNKKKNTICIYVKKIGLIAELDSKQYEGEIEHIFSKSNSVKVLGKIIDGRIEICKVYK